MRAESRLLSGASMENNSILCEHTLVMSGNNILPVCSAAFGHAQIECLLFPHLLEATYNNSSDNQPGSSLEISPGTIIDTYHDKSLSLAQKFVGP